MLKSFVFLTVLIINDVVLGAPDYKYNYNVTGWLKLHKAPATWHDALKTCFDEGAVLASPLTSQLNDALLEIMLTSAVNIPIFLGANSLWSGTDFISIEGVSLDDMSITWGSYGNGTKPEDCLTLSTDGQVYASSCKQYLPYICYKKNKKALQLNKCGTFDDDYHLSQITGSCYKVHEKKTSWNQAYKTCIAEGAHLVVVNDKQEADVVMALFPPEETLEEKYSNNNKKWGWRPLLHIGLRDWNNDFTWLTVTGDKVEDVYHKWALNQPDNRGINVCACLLEDGTLDDHWCALELKFVCEKDPETSRFERVVSGDVKYNREWVRQLVHETA